MRLDCGFWGPSATLPDEPPIDGEERESASLYAPYRTRNEWIDAKIRRQQAALRRSTEA